MAALRPTRPVRGQVWPCYGAMPGCMPMPMLTATTMVSPYYDHGETVTLTVTLLTLLMTKCQLVHCMLLTSCYWFMVLWSRTPLVAASA